MRVTTAQKNYELSPNPEAMNTNPHTEGLSDTPADIVKAAVEAGYNVTEAELAEAEQELRKQVAEKTDAELSADELEGAAGGIFWLGDDGEDGHEKTCLMFYHKLKGKVK